MVEAVAVVVMADVHLAQKHLVILDDGVAVLEIGLAGAQRLDLRSGQYDACFVNVVDVVIDPRELVRRYEFMSCVFFGHGMILS